MDMPNNWGYYKELNSQKQKKFFYLVFAIELIRSFFDSTSNLTKSSIK